MTTSNDITNWYSNVFKTWQAKQLGPKPTAAQLSDIHNLGARPGKQALASAMALRDCGVTGAQIVMACGAPQLNKMRGFITDGLLKRLPIAPSSEGHTVYKLELTAKGTKRIETAIKRAAEAEAAEAEAKAAVKAAKPAKAAKAAKPVKAAKAAAAQTPISEAAKPATVDVPVTVDATAPQPAAA